MLIDYIPMYVHMWDRKSKSQEKILEFLQKTGNAYNHIIENTNNIKASVIFDGIH